MNSTLKIGIAGLGRLGSLYVEYLAYQIPKAEVIAVTDDDEGKIREITKKVDIKNTYTDYREMLALKGLDAIVVTTPTSTHHKIVLEAANAGKMIFCEKPLSILLDEAEAMKQAVEKNGIFFHMGHMRRFDPGYTAAKQKISDGEIGKPIVFKATSRDPYRPSLEFADPAKSGGLFLDMGIHDFDLARWFMGEVAEVYSIGNILAYPEMATIGDIDNAIVNISFEEGTIGAVDLSRSGVYGYDIRTEILGTEGTIRIGYLRETPILVLKKEGVVHDTVPFFMERFEKAYIIQLKDFVERAYEEQEPSVTVDDGLAALAVSYAAASSYRQKKQVVIDRNTFQFESKIKTNN